MLRQIKFKDLKYIKELVRHFHRDYSFEQRNDVKFDEPNIGYQIFIHRSNKNYEFSVPKLNNIHHLSYFVFRLLERGFDVRVSVVQFLKTQLPTDLFKEICQYLDPLTLGKLSIVQRNACLDINSLVHRVFEAHRFHEIGDKQMSKYPEKNLPKYLHDTSGTFKYDSFKLHVLWRNAEHKLKTVSLSRHTNKNVKNFAKSCYEKIISIGCRDDSVAQALSQHEPLSEIVKLIDESSANNSAVLIYIVGYRPLEFVKVISETDQIYSDRVFCTITQNLFFKTPNFVYKYYDRVIERCLSSNIHHPIYREIINNVPLEKLLLTANQKFIESILKYIRITGQNSDILFRFYKQNPDLFETFIERLRSNNISEL